MTTLSEALAPRSDQLNSDDLIAGPRTLKLTGGRVAKDGRQTRLILSYEGDEGKPFKPCKTMGRAMVMAWGLTDEGFEDQVKGKSIRVYRDPEVTFGDQGQIGGIRISHMSDITKPTAIKLTVSQGKKSLFTFAPLMVDVTPTSALTIDQARADIEAAADLDALRVAWSRKSMAPFREQLQGDLDARKAALAEPETGRSNDQHGDQHDGVASSACADLLTRIEACTLIADVMAIEASYQKVRADMFEVAEQDQIETAIGEAKAKMKVAK